MSVCACMWEPVAVEEDSGCATAADGVKISRLAGNLSRSLAPPLTQKHIVRGT